MADKAFEKYGYVATLARTVPDLRNLLNQALAQKWDAARFSKELQDSRWWKNTGDSVKQLQILKATKPGEYHQQLNTTIAKVRALAGQMGVSLGEGTHSALAAVVNHALALGWDDNMIQQAIGGYYRFSRGKTSPGQAGALQQQFREIWNQYGLGISEDTVAKMTKNVLMGRGTVEGFKAQAAQAAKSRYAGFAQQLDAGQTMQDIAAPYIQTYAQTLELDPGSIDMLHDPYIQRALTARQPDGKPTAKPLWQFQDELRNDKRYDHTTQAVNDAYTMLSQIGKSWGYSA